MNDNDELILKQARQLYNVKLVKENTNGGSGNQIFEVETEQAAFILRVSKFTQKTKEHTEFELQWLNFLGANTHLRVVFFSSKAQIGSFFYTLVV